jgi:hypothetical protein
LNGGRAAAADEGRGIEQPLRKSQGVGKVVSAASGDLHPNRFAARRPDNRRQQEHLENGGRD